MDQSFENRQEKTAALLNRLVAALAYKRKITAENTQVSPSVQQQLPKYILWVLCLIVVPSLVAWLLAGLGAVSVSLVSLVESPFKMVFKIMGEMLLVTLRIGAPLLVVLLLFAIVARSIQYIVWTFGNLSN